MKQYDYLPPGIEHVSVIVLRVMAQIRHKQKKMKAEAEERCYTAKEK
jgi:hypothetical protein